jgi:hypothetical protein
LKKFSKPAPVRNTSITSASAFRKSSQPAKLQKQQTQGTPSAWMILPRLAPVSGKDAPYGADDEP